MKKLLAILMSILICFMQSACTNSSEIMSESVDVTPFSPIEICDYNEFPGVIDFGAYVGIKAIETQISKENEEAHHLAEETTGYRIEQFDYSTSELNSNRSFYEQVSEDYVEEMNARGFDISSTEIRKDEFVASLENSEYKIFIHYNLKNGDARINIACEESGGTDKNSSSGGKSVPTFGMTNALNSANAYLDVMAFSYSGLIEQLEYEGYTNDEATYAADNCGADWYRQAARSAKEYLETMSFSRQSLIEQLQYEGFTYEQAVYGVEQSGY